MVQSLQVLQWSHTHACTRTHTHTRTHAQPHARTHSHTISHSHTLPLTCTPTSTSLTLFSHPLLTRAPSRASLFPLLILTLAHAPSIAMTSPVFAHHKGRESSSKTNCSITGWIHGSRRHASGRRDTRGQWFVSLTQAHARAYEERGGEK